MGNEEVKVVTTTREMTTPDRTPSKNSPSFALETNLKKPTKCCIIYLTFYSASGLAYPDRVRDRTGER